MTTQGGDFLAMPPMLLATEALRSIQDLATNPNASVAEIRETAELALSRLSFLGSRRPNGAGRKASWVGRVTSFAFPRTFFTGTRRRRDQPILGQDSLMAEARSHHHVCFTIQITDGNKKYATGREVEVQVAAAEALRLGSQMIRIAQALEPPQHPRAASAQGLPPEIGRGSR
ncbi:hypothetical protein ACWD4O_38730 [Streptomyces sp. NPDC002623]